MIYLIFDTNIWIYFAEGQHPFVLNGILKKVKSGEIIVLVNEEIIKEWDRNKVKSLDKIKKELIKQIQYSKELSTTLTGQDSIDFKNLTDKISQKSTEFNQTIEERYKIVDDLIKKESTIVPIKDEHKLKVVEMALEQKAPFHKNKNSIADALILISSIDYLKKKTINNATPGSIGANDSIFISYNSEDFSKGTKGIDKNIIHPDLKSYLDTVGMVYERNFGKVINLTEKMTRQIDDYLNYLEDLAIQHFE